MVADGTHRVLYHLLWTVQVPDHHLDIEERRQHRCLASKSFRVDLRREQLVTIKISYIIVYISETLHPKIVWWDVR